MCYFNRKIGLPDLGIASFKVAINLHLTTMICYSMNTAVCDSNFLKLLALLQSFSSSITLKTENRVHFAGKGEMLKFSRHTYTKVQGIYSPLCKKVLKRAAKRNHNH